MKSQISTIALLLICLTSFGQVEKNSKDRSRFGLKAGPNYSSFLGKSKKTTPGVGFNAGAFFNLIGTKKYQVPFEVVYSQMSNKTEFSDFKLSMVNLNIMTSYFLTKHFYIEGGFLFGVYLSADQKTDFNGNKIETDLLAPDEAIPLDVSVGLGLGYEFTNRVFLNIRPSHGILPEMSVDPMFNTTFNIGYTF